MDYFFNTDFGQQIVNDGGSGNTISFSFNRPGDIKLHRNHEDLYIETHEGFLKIEYYFRNMDPNSSVPENAPRYSIEFQDGALSATEIQSLIMTGDGDDDTVGTQLDEFNTDPIHVNGGAGADWVEILNVPGDENQTGRVGIVDGGTGNDVYNLYTEYSTIAFARDSGRDLILDTADVNRPQYDDVTIAVNDSAGEVLASDISISFENGLFALRIAGSDAALLIGVQTAVKILSGEINWNVDVGGSLLSVQSLIQDFAPDGGSFIINTSSSYDGGSNSNNETVLSMPGNITSGSDNETFLTAGSTLLFQTGFGQDSVLASNTLHFEQDASDFTFTRDGNNITIADVNGNQLHVLSVFQGNSIRTGSINATFGYGGSSASTLSWEDLSTALAGNTDSSNVYLAAGADLSSGPSSEASSQSIYADIGTTTVNGGSGNNTLYVSMGTSIIHDTALGGHDLVAGGIYSGDFASLTIKAGSINDLSFEYGGSDNSLTIRNTVTGSSITYTPTGRNNLFLDDGSSVVALSSQIPTLLAEDNPGVINFPNNSATQLVAAASNTNDTLDGRVNPTFGKWKTFDGRGGSDIYLGGAGSDIFIYSGGGDDIIRGVAHNDFANVGYDIVDFRSEGISKASLSTDFSRDGDDLVFDNGSGTLRIEGFFLEASQSSLLEHLYGAAFTGSNPLPPGPDLVPTAITILRGFASTETPFSVTNVIDSLHFTDGIATKADILALFPDHAVPTPQDDELYAADLGNDIDALAGNDIVHGDSNNNTIFGNTGNDTLYGAGGDDNLDGGEGADTLVGGDGNDTYTVDNSGDVVTESADEGYDLVQSGVSFTLGDNIEDLTLTGTGNINGSGNSLSNFITGNEGNNIIDGGAGDDILIGGLGDDSYYVDSLGDLIIESEGEGTDTVYVASGIGGDYYAPEGIENVIVLGSSNQNVYGNGANNILTGNSGDNVLTGDLGNDTLTGGDGNDTLVGGAGNDIYVLSASDSGDTITELASEGTDTVQAALSYTLGSNLENLTLTGSNNIDGTGNGVANTILGNSGNNTLTGGAGNDTLKGGAGNDTYILTASGDSSDTITELSGEGTDTVQSAITHILGSNVENLTLTGLATINGTGNSLDNVITGNSSNNTLTGGGGNDTLNGGAGTDTLIGGTGNDTYILDATGDTITENAGEGTDNVLAGYSYTLGTNLENLALTGSGNFTGTGNTLDNIIIGNSGNNTLTGNAGNDTLKGGAGADQLLGGVGNDSYVLNRGDGADAITENDATAGNTDVARFGETGTAINHDQLWFKMNGSNLEVSVIGTSDKFTINSWSAGSARQVESFVASDGYHMTNAQVANLVSAMASFSPPAAGTTTLDPGSYSTVLSQIAVAWSA